MKHFLSLFVLLLTLNISAQQTPWMPLDVNLTSGQQLFHAPFELFAPLQTSSTTVTQTAQTDITAGQRVHLEPGFHAGDFSGNGYCHAYIANPADFDVVFIQPNEHVPQVGQFEKLEMGIKLPTDIEQYVNDYFAGSSGLNPFDPEQLSVEAIFTSGSSQYLVYGFYYQDFIRDPQAIQPFDSQGNATPAAWDQQNTPYHWRIRFAPKFLGAWSCSINIRVGNSQSYSYSVNNLFFNCVPSSNKGYLEKGADNWHLRYSGTHQSFFALGQDLAWPDNIWSTTDSYFRGGTVFFPTNPSYTRNYSGGYLDILDWISNLADNGGNMIRVVNVPWSYEIEFEQLNDYSGRMSRAWELDQLFELCEQKHIKIEFCVDHGVYADGNPPLNWSLNPYHRFISGIDNVEDFLTNSAATKVYKNKLRYYASRWGYSSSLGVFELASEISLWHYATGNFDNYQQTIQQSWHSEMIQYFRSLLQYRSLLVTSSYGDKPYNFNHNIYDLNDLDITTYHPYMNERNDNIERFHDMNHPIFNRGLHNLWPDKPAIFEETGMAEHGPADGGDITGCSDITYHNILWSTAFMGGYGAAFNWYGWNSSVYRANNFPAIHSFFQNIDFEFLEFKDPDFWDDAPSYDILPNSFHHLSTVETYYIRDQHANRVMGWVHNTSYWWGNIDQNCTDRNNLTMDLSLDNDDPASSPTGLPAFQTFKIKGLHNLSWYTVDWYSTRNNGGLFNSESFETNLLFGTLEPWYPGEGADYAYRAYVDGRNFRLSNEITTDTLLCSDDTLITNGNYDTDSLGQFHYHWIFGNGQQSYDRNATVIYSEAGTYLVTLIVSDSLGWADTLQQYVVKPPPCGSSRIASPFELEANSLWNAYPNPASDNLILTFDSSWSSTVLIELYSLDGKCVLSQSMPFSSNRKIPLTPFQSGVYLLRVKDDKHSETKRIIIEH